MNKNEEGGAHTIKSVFQAVRVLNAIAQLAGPASLKEIAAHAGMAPSKAHRYLQSLCEGGLTHQVQKSGAYDLGVGALRLGLAAINRVDIVNRAGDALKELSNECNADAFLSVWGENGPTMVRFERSQNPAVAMLGAGVSIPALNSATGMIFLAYADAQRTEAVVLRDAGADWRTVLDEVQVKLEAIRSAGYSFSVGMIMPERQCIAAPIISFDDQIAAAVTLVSASKAMIEPDSHHVKRLLAFCRRHSIRKRGYHRETVIEKQIAV